MDVQREMIMPRFFIEIQVSAVTLEAAKLLLEGILLNVPSLNATVGSGKNIMDRGNTRR